MEKKTLGSVIDTCEYSFSGRLVTVKSETIREFMKHSTIQFVQECFERKIKWNIEGNAETKIFFTQNSDILENGKEALDYPDKGKGKITVDAVAKFDYTPAIILFNIRTLELIKEEAIDYSTKCIACVENRKNMLFNCGHMSLCTECSDRVHKCPVCRADVFVRTHVYW